MTKKQKQFMTQDEIRDWLETTCRHGGLDHNVVATCVCSLCKSKCCDIHRDIYGEWIVCSGCWNDAKSGRKKVDPELKHLMDEKEAQVKAFFRENFGW